MGLTTEDEEPGVILLQGIPHESGKGNRLEGEGGSSRKRRRILRAAQRLVSVDGNPTQRHRAEDARIEWNGQEDEPDGNGESQSMLAHAKLSKTFWAEALTTTTYVINRSPLAPLDGDVPQRVWTCKDISYRHLKVFDCLSYVHVAKDKWRKSHTHCK